MKNSEVRRTVTVDVGTREPVSETCTKVTRLIKDHGWELHDVRFNAQIGGAQPVFMRLILVHSDPEAQPEGLGYRIDSYLTEPAS